MLHGAERGHASAVRGPLETSREIWTPHLESSMRCMLHAPCNGCEDSVVKKAGGEERRAIGLVLGVIPLFCHAPSRALAYGWAPVERDALLLSISTRPIVNVLFEGACRGAGTATLLAKEHGDSVALAAAIETA